MAITTIIKLFLHINMNTQQDCAT